MWAAGKNREQITRILLEAGADPTFRAADGKNALDYATSPYVQHLLIAASAAKGASHN